MATGRSNVLDRSVTCGDCGGGIAAGTEIWKGVRWDKTRRVWLHMEGQCPAPAPGAAAAAPAPRTMPAAPTGTTDLANLTDAQLSMRYGCTRAQYEVVRNHIARNLTPDQLDYFLAVAKMRGLSAWAKQVYAMVYKSRTPGKPDSLVLQTGIDGYTAIAHRSGQCDGIEEPEYGPEVETDGVRHPEWARVKVWRKGSSRPFVATARWSEYRKVDGKGVAADFWYTMPYGQLGKCALSRAIRLGFPEYVAGLFTHEEMAQASSEDRDVRVDTDGSAAPPLTPEEKDAAVPAEAREVPDPTNSPPAGGPVGGGSGDAPQGSSAPATPAPSPAGGTPAPDFTPASSLPPSGERDPALTELIHEIEAACATPRKELNARRTDLVTNWLRIHNVASLEALTNADVHRVERLRTIVLDPEA